MQYNRVNLIIPNDIESIAPNTTLYAGVDFPDYVIDISHANDIVIQAWVTGGNVLCFKEIEFYFCSSIDGIKFDTEPLAILYITLNGTNAVVYTAQIYVESIHYIKLSKIKNPETVEGYTANQVNVCIGYRIG